jgi:transcriptional regulator with XRE-family HTH domain
VPVDFSRKLDIALKALDLSRTRLAKLVGVDKSVASRWVSGASVPSAANLRALTNTLKKQLPGLSLADWELGIEAFAAKLGVSASAAAATDDAASTLLLRSIAPSVAISAARRRSTRASTSPTTDPRRTTATSPAAP